MKIEVSYEIEKKDLELNAGAFNRKVVKLAQDMHIKFMDEAVKLYKENVENIDLDTLPKHALPRWEKDNA